MALVRVSMLINDEGLGRFDSVVEQAMLGGVHVEQVLHSAGVLIGSVDTSKLAGLATIKGISNVEKERQIQIGPPEADVQ